jgi:hypothetical protein
VQLSEAVLQKAHSHRRAIEEAATPAAMSVALTALCDAIGADNPGEVAQALRDRGWNLDLLSEQSPGAKLGARLSDETRAAPHAFGGAQTGTTARSFETDAQPPALDVSRLTRVAPLMVEHLQAFESGDNLILRMRADSIDAKRVEQELSSSGFVSNHDDHPYYLANQTYRPTDRDGLRADFLVSVQTFETLESLLGVLERWVDHRLSPTRAKLGLFLLVHSRDGVAVDV